MTKLEEGKDYYFNEQGFMVLTEAYLLRRGYCCGNGCKQGGEGGPAGEAVVLVEHGLVVTQHQQTTKHAWKEGGKSRRTVKVEV